MSNNSSGDNSSASLVYKLASHIIKKPAEAVNAQYLEALKVLNCTYTNYDTDEFHTAERIKKKLMIEDRVKDALTFTEFHRKLQTSAVLRKRPNVLYFLYCLQGSDKQNVFSPKISISDQEVMLDPREIMTKQINKAQQPTVELGDILLRAQFKSSTDTLYNPSSGISNKDVDNMQNRVARVASLFSNGTDKRFPSQPSKPSHHLERACSARSMDSNIGSVCLTVPNLKLLLRDILYAVQGLKGEIISWDPERNNFEVVFQEDFPNPVKRITLRFMELGWMFCRINNYCKVQSSEKSLGLIAQSFVAVLKEKLVSYYKLIAELEALLTQENTLDDLYSSSSSLTLHKLSVWFFEPHAQLKILASVVDACKGKKGGALASVLYSHLQHGDHYIRTLVQNLLKVVTRPLFKMLSSWIYCGELEDAFGEFFVATNIAVPDCSLWQERYSLNKAMIPSFITMDQARKILSSGKAINFLRQICQDNTFALDEDRRMKALELMSTESLFSQEKDANFENILEKNYAKTSKTVLQVLHDKYHLMDHLLAMRNYFLLGQGDFIRHLMDLLDTDLAKPANSLYIHNLTGILESAIRATNAQFHNPEVLQRLDVRLLEVSIGDSGWDVFSLDYHVEGPIGTVFTPHCMNSYLRLFTTLWRAKRMEYILSKISQSRTTYLKLQEKIPEVTPVLYQCHITLAQMVHFVQQVQYYMAFEVMECCWADLLLKITSAHDLDEVIAAHENFLDTLITRALLDEESTTLRSQLKAIYECIIKFDKIQSGFWDTVRSVADKYDALNRQVDINTNKGTWGVDEKLKKEFEVHLEKLKTKTIPATKTELRVESSAYEGMVQKFLIMLNDQDDANLRFLSFRLDFNEHFKNKNSRLHTSLTYQNRRKSIK